CFHDTEDVLLAEDQMLLAVDCDLAAGVLAEQDPIALLDVWGQHLAVLPPAGSHRHDLPLLRLLLGGVGDDDAAGASLLALLDPLHDQAVLERADPRRHGLQPPPRGRARVSCMTHTPADPRPAWAART